MSEWMCMIIKRRKGEELDPEDLHNALVPGNSDYGRFGIYYMSFQVMEHADRGWTREQLDENH
jgi:hypothetical protein